MIPVFPVRVARLMTCVRVRAHARKHRQTGNTGNPGNYSIQLAVLLCLLAFPVVQVYRESTGNGAALGYLGQVSRCSSSPCVFPSRSPRGYRGQGNLSSIAVASVLLRSNRVGVRLPASLALFGYASNVQTSACVHRRLIQCAASIPRRSNQMRACNVSALYTGISAGPSWLRPPVAVGYADRSIYLYVLSLKRVVHGMGVGQSDQDRQVAGDA